MKKIMYTVVLALVVLSPLFFTSCEKYDPGATKTVDLAGEFYVRLYRNEPVPDSLYIDYRLMQIHNTEANTETDMWLTYDFLKIRMIVNKADLSYSASNYEDSVFWEGTISTLTGKLYRDASTLTSGVVMDSIAIEFQDAGDSNTVYYLLGARRSGFLEDEH